MSPITKPTPQGDAIRRSKSSLLSDHTRARLGDIAADMQARSSENRRRLEAFVERFDVGPENKH